MRTPPSVSPSVRARSTSAQATLERRESVLRRCRRRARPPGPCRCSAGWLDIGTRLRPRKSAFWITARALASAACVNCWGRQTSPAAYTARFVVRRCSSTVTPVVVQATPARSRPMPSTFGTRPAATRMPSTSTTCACPSSPSMWTRCGPSAPAARFHADDPCRRPHHDAVGLERRAHERGVARPTRASAGVAADCTSVTCVPSRWKRLRELAADGSAANHEQSWRLLVDLEHRLVGERLGITKAGIGGIAGRPPVAITARANRRLASPTVTLSLPAKRRVAEEHVHAERLEARHRVVRADRLAYRPDARHHRGRSRCARSARGRRTSRPPGRRAPPARRGSAPWMARTRRSGSRRPSRAARRARLARRVRPHPRHTRVLPSRPRSPRGCSATPAPGCDASRETPAQRAVGQG